MSRKRSIPNFIHDTVTATAPRPPFIYLARASTTPKRWATKIGCSTNVGQRLQSPRSPWGTPVTLVAAVPIGLGVFGEHLAREVEKALHHRFAAKRVTVPPSTGKRHQINEWFGLSSGDVLGIHATVAALQAEILQTFVPGEQAKSRRQRLRAKQSA